MYHSFEIMLAFRTTLMERLIKVIQQRETNLAPIIEQQLKSILFYYMLLTIKLDNNNFTIWRHQIIKILKSLKLDNFILKDSP